MLLILLLAPLFTINIAVIMRRRANISTFAFRPADLFNRNFVDPIASLDGDESIVPLLAIAIVIVIVASVCFYGKFRKRTK
jgi:hypothetical protein